MRKGAASIQGYRVWVFPGSASCARLDAKLTGFRRKPLSRPALFSLLRIDCFLTENEMRSLSLHQEKLKSPG